MINFKSFGLRLLSLLLLVALLMCSAPYMMNKTVRADSDIFTSSSYPGMRVEISGDQGYAYFTNAVIYAQSDSTSTAIEIKIYNTSSYSVYFDLNYYESTSIGDVTYNGSTTKRVNNKDFTGALLAPGAYVTVSAKASKILWETVTANPQITIKKWEVKPFDVTATVNNDEWGSVAVSNSVVGNSDSTDFVQTTTITATSKNAELYRFSSWTPVTSGLTIGSSANPLTLTVTKAIELTANFAEIQDQVDITVVKLPGDRGNIELNGTIISETAKIEANQSATLKAIPNTGYQFAGWVKGVYTDLQLALSSQELVTDDEMTWTVGDIAETWTAVFLKVNTFSVATNNNEFGTVSVSNGSLTNSSVDGVVLNTIVYKASPNAGYVFDGWYNEETGALESTSKTYSYTVPDDENGLALEARFRLPRVSVYMGVGVSFVSASVNMTKASETEYYVDVPVGTEISVTVSYDSTTYPNGIYCWYDNLSATELSNTKNTSYTIKVASAKDYSYTVFTDKDGKMNGVCKYVRGENVLGIYATLEAAFSYNDIQTGDKVILIQSATVSKDLTIPAGITLVVPYSAADNGNDADTTETSAKMGKPFDYILTVLEGVTLTVGEDAKLLVNAVQGRYSTAHQGSISGNYGLIYLNGEIKVECFGTLKARGVIKGSGKITTSPNANIYQLIHMIDFRGGTRTLAIFGKMFPINQFCVQNIQVDTEYVYGSQLYATYCMDILSTMTGNVSLVGSSGLFVLEDETSSAILKYDPNESKTIVEVHGNVKSNYLVISISGYSISTQGKVCPISAEFDIVIASDGKMTLSSDFRILPGVTLTVEEGGLLTIESGASIYLYSRADFLDSYCYVGYRAVSQFGWDLFTNTVSSSGIKYVPLTEDAILKVNGTVIVNGNLYCSANGQCIQTESDQGIIYIASNSSNSSVTECVANDSTTTVTFYPARGHMVTCNCASDGANCTNFTGATTYFSNGEAWYTHKTEFIENGDEYAVFYGVSNYSTDAQIATLLNDKEGSCVYNANYECSHWSDATVTAGTQKNPYTTTYSRVVKAIVSDFTQDYRVQNYLWFNGTVKFGDTIETLCAVDANGKEIDEIDAVNVNGTIYVVRRIKSDELCDQYTFYLSINGKPTKTSYTIDFAAYAETFSEGDVHYALVNKMVAYGNAANAYFNSATDINSIAQEFLSVPRLQEIATAYGATDATVFDTYGASFIFDERIAMGVYFSGNYKFDTSKYNYQMGILRGQAGSGALTTALANNKGCTSYVVYDTTRTGIGSDFGDNKPDEVTYDPIVSSGLLSSVNLSKYPQLNFDLMSTEYQDRFALRAFLVITDKETGELVRIYYGKQVEYGLEDYIYRMSNSSEDVLKTTFKVSKPKAFKEFLITAWNYAIEAEKAFE